MDTPAHEPVDVALPRLMHEHSGQIYALALRFCGDREEAEDLVQEVFLNAYRAWDGFRGESSERTWLYRIAARACQRMHRKRAGEPQQMASLDALLPFGDTLVGIVPSGEEDVVQQQIRSEAKEELEQAIVGLPDEFRIPLILKDIVGFDVREVASILGMEEGTVRSRVHRARLRLRAAVDRAIPRRDGESPAPAYDQQTCLDLLTAKQEAMDRGAPFQESVICERCQAVFASMDLAQDLCHEISADALPADVRTRLVAALSRASDPGH